MPDVCFLWRSLLAKGSIANALHPKIRTAVQDEARTLAQDLGMAKARGALSEALAQTAQGVLLRSPPKVVGRLTGLF